MRFAKCHPDKRYYARDLCKSCFNKKWWNDNLEKARYSHIKKRYGLSYEEHDQMLLEQDGRCAICHADDCTLSVDHDPETGTVRGLLCQPCNMAIGMLLHKPSILRNAVTYLLWPDIPAVVDDKKYHLEPA
jgi:hypothetical protein